MTTPVILTAGKATRAGDLAPFGCKSLVPLQGIPIIEWQLAVLKRAHCTDPIIVCRSDHADHLEEYGSVVVNDEGSGPAGALLSGMLGVRDPVIVAYSDTFFTEIPQGTDWVGVSLASGGRKWYVLHDDVGGVSLRYQDVPEGTVATVGVGLFHFSDPVRLRSALMGHARSDGEVGMDVVVNSYGKWKPRLVPSWQDVGDGAAIEAWSTSSWQDV